MGKTIRALVKVGWLIIAANEIRGLVMAVPVFYSLWLSGGTWMAIYLAACSLAGIAVTVAVPWFVMRRLASRTARPYAASSISLRVAP